MGWPFGDGALPEAELLRLLEHPEAAALAAPRPAGEDQPRVPAGRGRVAPGRGGRRGGLQAVPPADLVEIAMRGGFVAARPAAVGTWAGHCWPAASPPRGRWPPACPAAAGSLRRVTWPPSGSPAARTSTSSLGGWPILPTSRRLRLACRCAVALGQLLGRMHAQASSTATSRRPTSWPSRTYDKVAVWLIDLDGAESSGRPAHPAGGRLRGTWPPDWRPPWLTPSVGVPLSRRVRRRVFARRRRRLEGPVA